jgi:hypothetical protein
MIPDYRRLLEPEVRLVAAARADAPAFFSKIALSGTASILSR